MKFQSNFKDDVIKRYLDLARRWFGGFVISCNVSLEFNLRIILLVGHLMPSLIMDGH